MNLRLRGWASRVRFELDGLARPALVRLQPGRWSSTIPPDFLIVGLQKSGTNWVADILCAHPEVHMFPAPRRPGKPIKEGHFFDLLALAQTSPAEARARLRLRHRGFFRDLVERADDIGSEPWRRRMIGRYQALLQQARNPRSRKVGEKTPEYVFHLPMIESALPAVRKVCIVRNPLDRIVSYYFHERRKGRLSAEQPTDDAVMEYCERIAREYDQLIRYDGSLIVLSYEEMVSSTVPQIERLLSYLDLARDASLVRSLMKEASFEGMSGRKTGVEDNASHYRKGIVGEGVDLLTPDQVAVARGLLADRTAAVAAKFALDLTPHFEALGARPKLSRLA